VSIADVAARGFGSASDAYERGRPSYPAEALALLAGELALGPGATVVEVAAGTGKLTRLLTPTGARVVAVEPVAEMRRVLVDKVSGVTVVAGTAEALPLADRSVDAMVVAQAFHWFHPPEALAEVARVLRPGGGLGLMWNELDHSVPWVAELHAAMRRRRPQQIPQYGDGTDWAALVAGADAFTSLRQRQVAHEQLLDAETLVASVLSTSYIAAQPNAEQAALAAEVRHLLADQPESIVLPYRTDVFWCRRR
jgi:ubiquinone/menaquinone biosynthesis C-methylase UbiE